MLNDLQVTDVGWRLPDLAWGAEAWAIVRVAVPADATPSAAGRKHPVLTVTVTGQTMDAHSVALERPRLALTVLPPAELAALPPDELVVHRSLELEAAKFLRRVRDAADESDWQAVDRLLAQATARLGAHEWLATSLEAMRGVASARSRQAMMKEALYSEREFNMRLAGKDELLSPSSRDADGPAYLRRKPLQGKGAP